MMGGSESRKARGNPSEMGESKSISASRMGTFVAVRGTGRNALAPAGERDVRPAWPAVEDVPEERGEANAKKNAPLQRADPFCCAAHPEERRKIADAYTPSPPLRARKGPQQEHAAYSPPIPNRRLTKRDLGTYDYGSLNAIEAIANSVPYNENVDLSIHLPPLATLPTTTEVSLYT